MKNIIIVFLSIIPHKWFCFLRQEAELELQRMETTPGEPTNDNRVSIYPLWKACGRYYIIALRVSEKA